MASVGTAPTKKMVALVAGGASGLGKAVVQRLFRSGYSISLVDLPASEGAKVAGELEDDSRVLFTPTDISADDQVKKAMIATSEKFGKLDVLVNCAGISYAQKLYLSTKRQFMELERINKTVNVNLTGALLLIRSALPLMLDNIPDEGDQRGVIINTASIAAYDGQSGQSVYAATKGAIVSMTLPLARDYAPSGIRFNAIAPGLFDTPLLHGLPEKAVKFLGRTIPHPERLGQPDEFAALVEHIIENRYLNGEVIRLDGALRMPP